MRKYRLKLIGCRRRHPYERDRLFWAAAASLVVLAGFLRFFRLDSQLWLDEIAALKNYRKPFTEILTTFPGFFPHPLYEVSAHASLVLFGESALAIRLPAVLFGLAGVIAFYRLARRFSSPWEALLAGALFAVSYHHVFFSQNARGYTAFLFFALLSTDLCLTLLEAARWRTLMAYAGVAALTTYAQPFGLFLPMGQLLVALPVAWSHGRQGDSTALAPRHLLAVAVLTCVAILLLYAPYIRDSIVFSLTKSRSAAHGPKGVGLLLELLEGLRVGFLGGAGVVLAMTVGAIGTVDFLRRHPVALAVLAFPLLVTAAAVGVLGVGVHARYFLLALPVGYLVGSRGLVVAARSVLRQVLRLPEARAVEIEGALAVLLVILACAPLIRYYAVPKQDYLGALQQIRALAASEDRAVAADLAGRAIQAYYAPDFPTVTDLAALLHEEARGRRVWVVTTLERVMAHCEPDLLTHLHRHYRLVQVLPGSLSDGAMRIYMREP